MGRGKPKAVDLCGPPEPEPMLVASLELSGFKLITGHTSTYRFQLHLKISVKPQWPQMSQGWMVQGHREPGPCYAFPIPLLFNPQVVASSNSAACAPLSSRSQLFS